MAEESFLSCLFLADDNPYPVIDNDFLNDTIENIIQGDLYQNIDFLTGVTLNEGLYFAEYHIGHFYSDVSNQSASIGRHPSSREKRSLVTNKTAIIPPDIIFVNDGEIADDGDAEDDPAEQSKAEQKTQVEQTLTYEPHVVLDQFAKIDYIERYINANFQYGKCYVDEVKKRYEEPGNSVERHARETPPTLL